MPPEHVIRKTAGGRRALLSGAQRCSVASGLSCALSDRPLSHETPRSLHPLPFHELEDRLQVCGVTGVRSSLSGRPSIASSSASTSPPSGLKHAVSCALSHGPLSHETPPRVAAFYRRARRRK